LYIPKTLGIVPLWDLDPGVAVQQRNIHWIFAPNSDQFQLSRRATGSRRCLYRVAGAAPFAAAAATCTALGVRKRRALDNGGQTISSPASGAEHVCSLCKSTRTKVPRQKYTLPIFECPRGPAFANNCRRLFPPTRCRECTRMRAELVDLSLDEVWRGNPRSQTARVALPRIRWRDAGRMIQKAASGAGKYPVRIKKV